MRVCVLLTLIIVWMLSLSSASVTHGVINETFLVEVSQSKDMRIIYYYNFTNDYSVHMTVFAEASLDSGQSVLFILNNDDERVNHIKLINTNEKSVISKEQTICHSMDIPKKFYRSKTLKIEISTKSTNVVQANITIKILKNFEIKMNIPRLVQLDSMSSKYFFFKFDNDTSQVNVKVNATHQTCMILSIQDAECPVYELIDNVKSKGVFQSVSTSGSIVVQKSSVKDGMFYIVFVINNKDPSCQRNITKQQFTLTIEKIPSTSNYILPVFGAVGFYLSFYVIATIIVFTYNPWSRQQSVTDITDHPCVWSSLKNSDHVVNQEGNNNDVPDFRPINGLNLTSSNPNRKISTSSKDHNNRRLKTYASISDYFKKPTKMLYDNYYLFFWYLIIISVFYGLPVIQLVITYQSFLKDTGNQDICYYNFKCTRPFYKFTAFNNIVSNVGYVLLGFLFILMTWRRDFLYKQYKEKLSDMNQNLGIPQYYGLFYAMGFALFMEGIMSACYHICPTKSNIQFDTAFMYMMVCLGMLKVYQTRHPDFNASAQSFFMTMAFIIFVGVIGVNYNLVSFWVVFTIAYLVINVLVTVELYYIGQCKIDFRLLQRMFLTIKKEKCNALRPFYKIRMATLLIINVTNMILAIIGAILKPKSFTAFLLAILMLNLLLYLAIYVAMKIKYCEHFNILHISYIMIAVLCWGLAISCFIKFPTQWLKSPAESREQNLVCVLFDFYDIHDVWHFLSAMSLFFSFLALQTLDDNLLKVDRDKIPEF